MIMLQRVALVDLDRQENNMWDPFMDEWHKIQEEMKEEREEEERKLEERYYITIPE